jgi:hypothetical protein
MKFIWAALSHNFIRLAETHRYWPRLNWLTWLAGNPPFRLGWRLREIACFQPAVSSAIPHCHQRRGQGRKVEDQCPDGPSPAVARASGAALAPTSRTTMALAVVVSFDPFALLAKLGDEVAEQAKLTRLREIPLSLS